MSSDDLYQQGSEIAKISLMIKLLEMEGRYQEANELRSALDELRSALGQLINSSISSYRGYSERETIENIKNGVLSRFMNDNELARWVYEELDAAYVANFDYGFLKNTRDFALNAGIPQSDFRGTLNSQSSIDRAGGPQQFIMQAMEYFFGEDTKKKVSIRIGIVKDIIKIGFSRGVF